MNYVCTFTDKHCIKNVLQVWLPTLKKNFTGKIVVIVFDVSKEDIQALRNQDVIVIEEDNSVSGMYRVIARRLAVQEKFIKTLENNDKIMLIDASDVVFQSEIDSFFDIIGDKLYYSTTGTLSNRVTFAWMKKILKYSHEQNYLLEKLKTQEVVASGMLAGTKKSFLRYFKKHKRALSRLKIKYFTGINQAILTYLILKNSNDFEKTDIHNCRVLDKDVIKENDIYKIHKTIPIIHFSCGRMKAIYKTNYLDCSSTLNTAKKDELNILWLYGSVPKFDVINHWYHTGFARVINTLPNVNLMIYGKDMKKLHPDLAKIEFNPDMKGIDVKKEFDFDVIIMDNKNRFAYSRTYKERRAKKPRDFWLKPEFFDGLDNIPKVFLEGDYHLHFRMAMPDEKTWYEDRKVDLLLVRHLSALAYHKNPDMPIEWFPCSVNTNVFKPNPNIDRINKLCLISGYGINYYNYRNTAGKILQKENLIDIYDKRFLGDDYIKNLQSYVSHVSGSSIRAITAAKMFEYMASGTLLFTDAGDEYGLKELFPDDSYVTYNKVDYSDVIPKAKKIINEPEFRKYTTEKALKCIKERHTHEIRAKELIDKIVKRFGISYDNGETKPKSFMAKIGEFFTGNNQQVKIMESNSNQKESIKLPEEYTKNLLSPEPVIDNTSITAKKNEEKIKTLYNQDVNIYLLKDTCYNVIINDQIGDNLTIAVNKESMALEVFGPNFKAETMPEKSKYFMYNNMKLKVPYPLIPYLTNIYGKVIVDKLKLKKKRLILIEDIYKFSNR